MVTRPTTYLCMSPSGRGKSTVRLSGGTTSPISLRPVSYTHLDVYKRQLQSSRIKSISVDRNPSTMYSSSYDAIINVVTTNAVSYTHLEFTFESALLASNMPTAFPLRKRK